MISFKEMLQEKRIEVTDQVARSASWDAGNENMKKHKRTEWNEEDYNVAVKKYNELMGYK